jgi:hypothetical protein
MPLAPTVVGRSGELDALRAGLDAAIAGTGSTIVLVGEPGVGKTRLLRELRSWCGRCGFAVLVGRVRTTSSPAAVCVPGARCGRRPPRPPGEEMLREAFHDDVGAPGPAAASVADVVGVAVVDEADAVRRQFAPRPAPRGRPPSARPGLPGAHQGHGARWSTQRAERPAPRSWGAPSSRGRRGDRPPSPEVAWGAGAASAPPPP